MPSSRRFQPPRWPEFDLNPNCCGGASYQISDNAGVATMTENQTASDLLSDLPLGIIHIILALIPIREAVRTCILSRQWRYIWTSLPVLVFDAKSATTEDKSETKYEDIITRILFRHTGPIHKFKHSCFPFRRCIPIFAEWIYFLSRHGIKEIILDMGDEESYRRQLVHSSIYSCGNLTNLKLELCELDPVPLNFKGFFSLKTLNLNMVTLSHNGIGSLVSACPVLERLTVIQFIEIELNISAPNLKYLKLSGYCKKICLYAPLLVEMDVHLMVIVHRGERKRQKTSLCNYKDLLSGVADLKKLAGSCEFSEYLSIGIDCSHNVLVFHNLKFVDLCNLNFQEAKELLLLSRLLIGAPNLRQLNINTDYNRPYQASGSEAPHLSFGFAPFFKFEKLRVVKMEEFNSFPMEIELIKILLESSPVLETMSIEIGSEKRKKKKKQLMDELVGCSFASPVVKLSIL